jgi:subtilisin family serine protease
VQVEGRADSELAVLQEVAALFADRFDAADRVYEGIEPAWHGAVLRALAELREAGLVGGDKRPALTDAGRARAAEAVADTEREASERSIADGAAERSTADGAGERSTADGAGERSIEDGAGGQLVAAGVIAQPLRDKARRQSMAFPSGDDEPMPVMIELNLRYGGGRGPALEQLRWLWSRVTGGAGVEPLADEYATGELSMNGIKRLVAADAAAQVWPARSIYRIWPDFPVKPHIDASAVTVKADAARRSFNSLGDGIVWAVIDSGIWGNHPHFASHGTLSADEVKDLHRFFPAQGDPVPGAAALEDETGHGTHVAGIIAGGVQAWLSEKEGRGVLVTESRYNVENPREPLRQPRSLADPSVLAGMAPRTRLVSLKVLTGGGSLDERVSRVIKALAYVREVNGYSEKVMRIHGVNLSIGYEFDPEWFACGQSPLCQEVDKLVRTGVVVVVAAGNSGYGSVGALAGAPAKFGLGMTINDPGNAERAITVGATHRDMPHTFGVSYFSSKGPTGDGRCKPDLVAPGERITSCAAGASLAAVVRGDPDPDTAVYVEDTGTSMAAPHVSGAIAALLSVRREFIGKPEEIKRVVVDSAMSLGRERHFQGAGLIDLMRALQSI